MTLMCSKCGSAIALPQFATPRQTSRRGGRKCTDCISEDKRKGHELSPNYMVPAPSIPTTPLPDCLVELIVALVRPIRRVFAISSLERRYWAKVDRRNADECWLWKGCTNSFGYGVFTIGPYNVGATRIGWMLSRRTPPGLLFVCHSCDNPGCCNPAHWFLGTNADNLADMRAKGRGRLEWGETNPGARLTAQDVSEIRQGFATGRSNRVLAEQFNVSPTAVSNIRTGRTWRAAP